MKHSVFITCILAYTTQALDLANQGQSNPIMEPEEYLLGETWTDAEASAQPLFEWSETRYLRKLGAVRRQFATIIRDAVTKDDCAT